MLRKTIITLFVLCIIVVLTACEERSTVPEVFTDSTQKQSVLIQSNDIGESVSNESLYYFGYDQIKNHEILLKLEVYSNGSLIDSMYKKYSPSKLTGSIGLQFIHFTKQNGQKNIQWAMEIDNNLSSITTEDIFADLKEYSIETIQREVLQVGKKVPLLIYYSDVKPGSSEEYDNQKNNITSYVNKYKQVGVFSIEIFKKKD